jgi:hypothetical protein
MRIDTNFRVTELDFMDTARSNSTIAYIVERFVIAMGGISFN